MSRERVALGIGLALVAAGLATWGFLRSQAVTPTPVAVAPEAAEAPSPERPNVLVIVWDTVRADHLSVYGYDRPTTPHLEAFAKDARVYENAWSPGIWTLAAHASVFTGLPVESTGADERWMWLDSHHQTLAEQFGDHGYDTFAFSANALLARDTNLVQGFRVVLNTWKGKVAPMAKQATIAKLLPEDKSNELTADWRPPNHGATNAEWAKAEYKEAGPLIGEGFLKWLDRRPTKDQPFLAYLNMMEAHTPRIPSMEGRKAVMTDPQQIELGLSTDQGHINLHFYNFDKYDYTEAELAAINGVYDAALWDLDQATHTLMQGLEARGLLDNTIVVLTSDHGENLGDHHLFNHRLAMYESLLHVPLIIRYPEGLEPGREDAPVSTLDLYATLADLADVPTPPGLFSESLKRDKFAPPVAFMALPLEREIRTVQKVFPDVKVEPWIRTGHAVRSGEHKYVHWENTGATELFDLGEDPGEGQNLSGKSVPWLEGLEGRLGAYRLAVPPYDPTLREEADNPRNVRASQKDLRNQLEALGYVSGD